MKLYDTMTDLLRDARSRDREIRFIDGEHDESVLSFADLWSRAVHLLGALQLKGMQPGDELVIFSKSNEAFVVAFWAAILGGIVPVPVAVGISDEHRFKLFRILRQLERGTLFTDLELLERLVAFANDQGLTDVLDILELKTALISDASTDSKGELAECSPDDTAFIQYSSGSTSDPKGVVLSHRNLCTNVRAICEATGWMEDDQSLSWMPLTHDMGLIGYHLSVLAAGMNHAVMDTNLFVRRPLLWMQKASELRATQLCSPNFGYKHFLKLFERKGLSDVNLSSVKLILNGAEPISWDLCVEFMESLAPLGLKREAMYPVYGLAEATVGVSLGTPGDTFSRVVVDRHQLKVGEPLVPVEPDNPDSVSFLRCGSAIRDVEIRIADDSDRVLADGNVGHIQLRGASVTERIYGDPEATSSLFTDDGWLRTGDVGAFDAGQLVITGRQKDLIILNGQNYYPHDLEEIICELDELDLGKVAISGTRLKGDQTESLIVFVLYRKDPEDFHGLATDIRDLIGSRVGLEVDYVVPVARIPKTTSGKVQRAHLLRDFIAGEFDNVLSLTTAKEPEVDADEDPFVAELVQICKEFSKERTIGPDDNLFEVGVSSLTLTEITLAIDERYPGKLDISDLFDYPTLREIADFIRKQESA